MSADATPLSTETPAAPITPTNTGTPNPSSEENPPADAPALDLKSTLTPDAPAGEDSNDATPPDGQEASDAEKSASDAASEAAGYEPFTLPDHYTVAPEDLQVFTELGQSLKLDQTGAQSLVDLGVQLVESNTQQMQALAEQEQTARVEGWKESLRNDPELGGENAERTQKNVAQFEQLGLHDAELIEVIQDFGLDNHPAVIRLFDKIGALSREDPVTFGADASSQGKSPAQRMFANSDMQ